MEFIIESHYDNRSHKVTHWAVFVVNQISKDYIFLKSFYTEQRAKDFTKFVEKQVERGDYSCLTLVSNS